MHSLLVKLKDTMTEVNAQNNKNESQENTSGLTESELADKHEDEESKSKLNNIEIELEDIAHGVRENLQSIFQRGEKFDSLAKKSDKLKNISSGLKKKAVQIRKDSEPFNLAKLLMQLFGIEFSPEQAYAVVGIAFGSMMYFNYYILG